jgi:hypothetical protein
VASSSLVKVLPQISSRLVENLHVAYILTHLNFFLPFVHLGNMENAKPAQLVIAITLPSYNGPGLYRDDATWDERDNALTRIGKILKLRSSC